MLDKELLKSFENLEKLQEDGVIEYYKFNSKEWDFTIVTEYGEKVINIYETDEESISEFIEEMEKEVEEAFKDKKREEQDREAAYWAVQGVRY